jgi:hypothetical protein
MRVAGRLGPAQGADQTMFRSKLQYVILGLNLKYLLVVALTLLILSPPFRASIEGAAFGYGVIWVMILSLSVLGSLSTMIGVLTVTHLVKSRRWSWDLLLSVLTCGVIPALIVMSAFSLRKRAALACR